MKMLHYELISAYKLIIEDVIIITSILTRNSVPHKIIFWNLMLNAIVLRGKTFRKWWGHKGGDVVNMICAFRKRGLQSLSVPSIMWKYHKKVLSMKQKENLLLTPNSLAPWPWTSQVSKLWAINYCCLYIIILWYSAIAV